jgi:hypothetical protein
MKYPSNFLPILNISQTNPYRNPSMQVVIPFTENDPLMQSPEYIFFPFFATMD